MGDLPENVIERHEWRDKAPVYRNRSDAGKQLAVLLDEYRHGNAILLAIPAGGVPVGVEMAHALQRPLALAPASKVLLPWTTEAGYGAVAYDGSVWLNHGFIEGYGLDESTIQAGIMAARRKVQRRVARFGSPPDLAGRQVILIDDGLAAGSTLRAAIGAVKKSAAESIIIAVPTGHYQSVLAIAAEVDKLYCPNIRSGPRYAVAEAYEYWSDVSEDEVADLLLQIQSG